MTSKIIILCPGNVITGGVNSLHNLCEALSRNGFDASMYYFDSDKEILNNDQIKSYNVKQYTGELDQPNHTLIVSETKTEKLSNFSKATKIIYWLGIKFYFKSPKWKAPFNKKIFRKFIYCQSYYGYSSGRVESLKRKLNNYAKSDLNIWTNDYIHISNSNYVANYCKEKGANNVFVIHNPIRNEFYNKEISKKSRKKNILFGAKTSKSLIFYTHLFLRGYKIIQIKKMPLERVVKLMSESKVFAEFGANHGRDRMPREAAMLGCIVFLTLRGSSALKADYQVDDYYRIIDKIRNYPLIIKRIKKAAQNYDETITDFHQFRNQLINEKENFDSEVIRVFSRIL